ncbi:MAG: hypothetical protein OdinLCB4_007540 [Candidatus Odinarchaeum yellowstonii]|uniref:Uncharacterized protein n=1 Tax=Odinarchaeota yellowstonii (strain LCB_4) TaxID=1841599 RepID=A0AAF0D269_ODILC|nr:MAG: hypothetical protein OdinLCB4_007540 [Candidatus Odinarchaeum yellowstonii]
MSDELEKLGLELKQAADTVQVMLSKASSIISEPSEILEFAKLLLNEVEKLNLELKLGIESSGGIKGLFGARKKYVRLFSEKLSKLNSNMIEAQNKIYKGYLDYLTGFEEYLRSVEQDYNLVEEETVKRKMNWSSLVQLKYTLKELKSGYDSLIEYIDKLKFSSQLNIGELETVTENVLGWRNRFEEFKKRLEDLQRRVAFRNIVYAKIMDIQGGLNVQLSEFFKTLGVHFNNFLDKLASKTIAEETEELFLEEVLQLIDPVNECFKGLGEIIFLLQDAGIPLKVVLEQGDVKNSLTLFKIILEKFKIGFKEYIEQEYLFVDKLKQICSEINPVVKSILSYLDRLGEAYKGFRNRILDVVSSWLINFKQKGGWEEVRKLLIVLENFLLNHYPAINECIRNRLRGVNPSTIRGAALFQNCIPTEYVREQFIYDTILPIILEEEGVHILMNVLQAYGERGWVKRAEVKNISSEYIENYLKTAPSIKLARVEGYEILFSPDILVKKIKNISKESLYNYFNKYLANSELCEKISEEVLKSFSTG